MDNRRMRELEDLCVQEDHPFCQAACPVGMDCRGLCADLAEGLVDQARMKVEEGLPLPLLLCLICDEPCAKACVRGIKGDSISMAALERFALREGAPRRKKPSFLAPRPNKVALIGEGLAAMAALESLRAKRYDPKVYVTGDSLAGPLQDDPRIPRNLLDDTVEGLLAGLDVEYLQPDLDSLSGWDCIVVADTSPLRYPGPLDDLTYATGSEGIFSLPMPSASPVEEARRGREIVLSLERHLQGASLSAGRSRSSSTRLPLPPEVEEVSHAVRPKGEGFDLEEARSEASRCLLCQCLKCQPWCLYLQEYGGSPRRYVRTFHNNLIINKGNRTANRMIDSCTLCGLCAQICPTGLDVGQASLESRRKMVETGHMPPSHHDYPLRDMASALEETDCTVDPSGGSPEWLFFPGCQLGASDPRWVTESYRYLTDRLGSVALWVSCCGAPARWGGREELFSDIMDLWAGRWEELGRPKVITACSTCHSLIRERIPEDSLTTLWEVMDGIGLPMEGDLAPLTVTVSDPCTARHHRASQDSVRRLLAKRGVSLEEHRMSRETTECCGFGGLVFSANPDLARRSAKRRADDTNRPLVVFCALCHELYGRTGHDTWHILDLLLSEAGTAPHSRPFLRWSDRRENRRKLKAILTGTTAPEVASSHLNIEEPLRRLLDERWIMDSEILAVIEEAESGGPRLKRKDSEVYLAHSVLGERTLWVQYSRRGDLWVVHDSYSHRMTIGEVRP